MNGAAQIPQAWHPNGAISMKRIAKTPVAPQGLLDFQTTNPNGDWGSFRSEQKGALYRQIQQQLLTDQRHLCAYCEIDLKIYPEKPNTNDFRVEHFHPKSPHDPPPNWALDWSNMLACCHGGSQRDVNPTSRFTDNKERHTCDVPKENHDWTDIVLNPLDHVPARPSIFEFDQSGHIKVSRACPSEIRDRAQASIDRHRLDDIRLRELRKAAYEEATQIVNQLVQAGRSLDAAMQELATMTFQAESTGAPWPAFFTCIRFVLGAAAEMHLQTIHYQG